MNIINSPKEKVMTHNEMVEICNRRDLRYHGKFYLAVKSTKIVCHPDCPTKLPLKKNMEFFNTLDEAVKEGYRPCKVCMKEHWKE